MCVVELEDDLVSKLGEVAVRLLVPPHNILQNRFPQSNAGKQANLTAAEEQMS